MCYASIACILLFQIVCLINALACNISTGKMIPNKTCLPNKSIYFKPFSLTLTLGLVSSRVGERGSHNQLLEDLERLLTFVRFLKTRYQARYIESVAPPGAGCPKGG